jgi:putative phage-type endonuclease
MKAIPLGHHQPNTPEWDALRANGIGGSEIAAVVGLSPWESRFSLWHRKRGNLGRQTVNASMDWGTRLEDVIADAYAETRNLLDIQSAGTYAHHQRPWQIANPDRLLWDDKHGHVGLLEVKTASAFDVHEWGREPDAIPPYYRCQVLWYMDALELPRADLAVLIGGSDYREYTITYSPGEAAWLRDQGAAFWQSVLVNEMPDIDGSDATYEAVRALNPDINGDTVEVDPDLHDWFQTSKKAAEAAKAEHTAAKATLLDSMGQAKYAELDGQRVYRRQNSKGGIALYSLPPFRGDQPKTLKETA